MNKTYTERAFAHFCASRKLDNNEILKRLRAKDNSQDREAWALIAHFYRMAPINSHEMIGAMCKCSSETVYNRLRGIEGRL